MTSSVVPKRGGICDFCTGVPVRWLYGCREFPMSSDGSLNSVGVWGACEECHKLLSTKQYAILAVRVADTYDTSMPWEDNLAIAYKLLKMFAKHRTGCEVTPYVEEPQFAS